MQWIRGIYQESIFCKLKWDKWCNIVKLSRFICCNILFYLNLYIYSWLLKTTIFMYLVSLQALLLLVLMLMETQLTQFYTRMIVWLHVLEIKQSRYGIWEHQTLRIHSHSMTMKKRLCQLLLAIFLNNSLYLHHWM
jgi:hypothetical protein